VTRLTVAERFEGLFPGERITLVDRADAMAEQFDRLTDQRPSTCGAYALSYLLPALGYARHDGHDLAAEDYLAHLAGVVIEGHEVGPSREVDERIARGELTETQALEHFGRIWYRFPVRSSDDPAAQGTSPTGIARAISVGTGDRLATVPVAGRTADGDVALDQPHFTALFDLLEGNLGPWSLHAILNYQSDHLLAPRSPEYTAENLRAPGASDRLPRDDWGVGHFSGLAGLWRRPDGERWMLLFDTYKERGFDGYQPQPAELVRRGLVRSDGRGGGMLVIVPRDRADEVVSAVRAAGVEPRMWSNGSPEPDDYAWSLPAAASR
jgi:hypothetical protein